MKEQLMNEVENTVVEEGMEVINSHPNTLMGIAAGVGIATLSVIAYKKVLKPVGIKIKEKIAKKSESVSVDCEVID